MSTGGTGPVRTALVVGHRGQDGTLLSARLRAEGTRVVGVGRPGAPGGPDDRVVDVSDAREVESLVAEVDPDEIYYLAAHHGSSEAMPAAGDQDDVRRSWAVHVAGPENLLNAVARLRSEASILLASSCLVHAPSPAPIDEAAALRPDTVYGLTKAAAVVLARERRRAGMRVWTATLFPHESGLRPESFVASRIVRAALRISAGSREAIVVGDPAALVDWSLASNVVGGMIGLLRSSDPDEYVFASGEGRTVAELCRSVLHHLDLAPEQHVITDPSLLRRPSVTRIGDPTRIREAIDWTARPAFTDFVRVLIDDHRTAVSRAAGA